MSTDEQQTGLEQPRVGFTDNVVNSYNNVSLDWHVAGVADLNGDTRSSSKLQVLSVRFLPKADICRATLRHRG